MAGAGRVHGGTAVASINFLLGTHVSNAGRVLVIDDDDRIRELVCEALRDEGYVVETACNGAEALDLLFACWDAQPDVILLDMRMPSLDGWKFVEAYRMLPVPQAPIVVMTAARRAEDSAAQVQADGVLPKPFDLGDLLERVYRVRRIRRAA
jgi:CheY-like chemotaxis protein